MDEKHENIEDAVCENSQVEILLHQWQTCVGSADNLSQRRDVINGIFTTLSLAIVTSAIALWGTRAVALLIMGCVICIAWLLYIWSLKLLNSSKFDVIHKLERSLPAQPYKDEWDSLKAKRYVKGTSIERLLPVAFIALYAVLLFLMLGGNS
jgi:hypothetical protein